MNLKKILSLLLVCAFMLGLMAGCGGESSGQGATSPEGQEDLSDLSVGQLVLNCDAAFEIRYDKGGFVTSIDGIDEVGISIVDRYNSYIGKSCADAVRELLQLSAEEEVFTPDTPAVVIKQGFDSTSPSEDFLSKIVADAKTLSEGIPVFLIAEKDLTENGYISFDTAKELLTNYLDMEDPPAVTGDPTPVQGLYALSISSATQVLMYTVDANTGKVATGYPGGSVDDYILDIDPNGAMYDPDEPYLFPDEIATFPEETEEEFSEETEELIYEEPETEAVS